MEYPRGIYKEEVYPGLIEYRAYTQAGRLCSRAEIPADFATAETDEAFNLWLDMLDPPGASLPPVVTAASAVLSPPASGGLAA
jgi:hypothetical protein